MTVLVMSMDARGIEDRFKDTVAVERNASVDGSTSDDEGIVSPVWVPITGLGSVACLICEDTSRRAPSQEYSEDLTPALILFSRATPLPRDQLLRFATVDPGSGLTIYYYAEGKIGFEANAYRRVRVRLGAIVATPDTAPSRIPVAFVVDAIGGCGFSGSAVPDFGNILSSGPATGDIGVAASFVVMLEESRGLDTVITPAASNADGVFSPATVTIPAGETRGAFDYTPSVAGTRQISLTNDSGLDDPDPMDFVATDPDA